MASVDKFAVLKDGQSMFNAVPGGVQILFLAGLQDAYSGTILADVDPNEQVITASIISDVAGARTLSENIIKNRLKLNIQLHLDQTF